MGKDDAASGLHEASRPPLGTMNLKWVEACLHPQA